MTYLKITRTGSLLLSLALFSCSSSKNISGTYHSKFASLGMFGTTVRLKPESRLQYVFQGDLMYDSATGHYQVYGNKIYVLFDREKKDTNKLYYRFDNMPVKTTIYKGDTIQYKLLLYCGHNKLFPGHFETGRKITTAKGYSRRRKYLFFGSHYHSRRYYYKRIG